MLDLAVPRSHVNTPIVDFFLNPLLGARRMSITSGSIVHEPAQPASSLYFIHRGQVRIFQTSTDNSTQLVEILGVNDWFGAASLAGGPSHGSRAIAEGNSIISEIAVERVFALLLQQPKVGVELIKALALRLRNAREEAGRLVFDDCHSRLLKTLLRFSRSAAASQNASGIALHITHQELAQAIGVARETVSLALKDLRDQHLLRTGRNQVLFDPVALETFVNQHTPANSTQPPSAPRGI